MKNFAITGAAGFVAPRHIKAIYETGNRLVAAVDPHDSVGILDSYDMDISFFKEFERFDRHLHKLRRLGEERQVHFLTICSPNHLHDAHIRFALRSGAHAICEKPLVLNPWNLDALADLEQELGRTVYTVLQLRVHPSIIKLREQLHSETGKSKHEVELTYITSRGTWYLYSWKGQPEKSGGLTSNIGIHFFDMLMWLFGGVEVSEVHMATPRQTAGYLELEHARVRWMLSIDPRDLPAQAKEKGLRTFRSITIDGAEMEFSGGFIDLHTRVYEDILSGRGYGIADARPSIRLVHDLRHKLATGPTHNSHPFLKR